MSKLLIIVNELTFFISHRLPLGIDASQAGYDVVIVGQPNSDTRIVEKNGLRFIPLRIQRRRLSPFAAIKEIVAIVRIILREKPDIVHLISLRPILLGGLAIKVAGIRQVVFSVTGMGYMFTEVKRLGIIRKITQWLLPRLMANGLTIVQNRIDARELIGFGVPKERVRIIPGAGVDLDEFKPVSNKTSGAPLVMMASRLLRDKGVMEFVSVAEELSSKARFVLVGQPDPGNPASISKNEIEIWARGSQLEWWGHCKKMPQTLGLADIVCLPSYREGLPKVLLEAMACGKPCITTDAPGCRDVVTDKDNGLLVPVRDRRKLRQAILWLIDHPHLRDKMGKRGRQIVVKHFSRQKINSATLKVYKEVQDL